MNKTVKTLALLLCAGQGVLAQGATPTSSSSSATSTQTASAIDKFRVPEVTLSRLCLKYKEMYPSSRIDAYLMGYPLFLTHELVLSALEKQGLKITGDRTNPADRLNGFYRSSFTGTGGTTQVLYDTVDRYKTEVCIVRP